MDVNAILEHIRHKLPAQGPIKDFIHHNTLHAFQHLPFHEALQEAGEFYGAKSYMPEEFYSTTKTSPLAPLQNLERGINQSIQPILIRLTSGFLDQGIALSPFPESNYNFFEALGHLANNSIIPIAYFVNKKRTREYFQKSPEQVCEEILKNLVKEEAHFESYITETLMAQRGWSGMINSIEKNPGSLLVPRAIKLIDFLALKLILEWEFILFSGVKFVPAQKNISLNPSLKNLHEEFENKYYHEVLSKFKETPETKQEKPHIQAVFCIDDRECSFRRHLEQADSQIETFATAGFFGIDFFFQSLNDTSPKKLCPAPVQPKHLIFEKPHPLHQTEFENQKKQRQQTALWLQRYNHASSSLFLGFIAANTLGHLSFLRLIASFLNPSSVFKSLSSHKIKVRTELTLHRKDELTNQETRLYHGFNYDEMASRVFSVLKNMGLTHDLAPLIAIIAHGSSSLNNPHFAAYDCGACSGNPGAPNARAFASMANLKPVRERVEKLGLSIRESTQFIGGFHDTCTDAFDFFDIESLSTKHLIIFSNFSKTLEIAKRNNAQERCRKFAVVKPNISPRQALSEVQHRATVLFEPRPELGHAGNALCIVGRRSLTKHLSFDRRAFKFL